MEKLESDNNPLTLCPTPYALSRFVVSTLGKNIDKLRIFEKKKPRHSNATTRA